MTQISYEDLSSRVGQKVKFKIDGYSAIKVIKDFNENTGILRFEDGEFIELSKDSSIEIEPKSSISVIKAKDLWWD